MNLIKPPEQLLMYRKFKTTQVTNSKIDLHLKRNGKKTVDWKSILGHIYQLQCVDFIYILI